MPLPTLVVVSGPPGSGKTTLARALGDALGCPVVSRDEIKEGMVRSAGAFIPSTGDVLTQKTFGIFFDLLRLLLGAGVTVVAEAAFQDKLWSPALASLSDISRIKIVHCSADPTVARARIEDRLALGGREAHADGEFLRALDAGERLLTDFDSVRFAAPALHVNTDSGTDPGLDAIVSFVLKEGQAVDGCLAPNPVTENPGQV